MKFQNRCVSMALGIVALSATGWSEAQIETRVDLDPSIECWYHDAYPSLDAVVDPGDDVARTRLYFRCMLYPDYYFVDLAPLGQGYRAVAPKAEEACGEVSYYVEVVHNDFTSARTPERTADVTSLGECRRRDPAVAFFDGEPTLLVGTTSPNLLELIGFKADGVYNFLAATGEISSVASAASSGGASISSGVIIGVGAAAAGGAAIYAAVGGNSNNSTQEEMMAETPPATSLPPPMPAGPDPPLNACFDTKTLTPGSGCDIEFDASCSEGDIVRYEWLLDSSNSLGFGTVPATGVVVSHDWVSACGFMPPWPNIQTILTVFDADGNSATASRSVTVQAQRQPQTGAQRMPAVFISTFSAEPEDGSKSAQVHHNDRQVDTMTNSGPFQHRFDGRPGENVVVAHALTPIDKPVLWRFDFRGVPDFVAGSLQARSGQVVSVGARSIVFRLSGSPGERLRFVYALSR